MRVYAQAAASESSIVLAAPSSTWQPERRCGYRLGKFVVTHYTPCSMAVIALMAFNVFWHLPATAILNLDEARYGVAASEMLRAHQHLVPTYAGRTEYWNLKPPLGYWLLEASYHLLGPSVLALRLPSALSALAVVWLTMLFCRRSLGARAAILSGLMVATCYGFLSNHGARNGGLDAELTLMMALGMALVPNLHHSGKARLGWGALLGLAFLLKSFAILPFVLAATAYLVMATARPRSSPRQWLPAIIAFLVLVGGWMLARTLYDGTPYYVERMVSEDLLMRATHNIDGGTSHPWSYALGLLDRFAPWPLFVIFVCIIAPASSLSRRHRAALRLLLLWALTPLLLFSLARTHHHWYLDPAYPAWAMLAAYAVLKTFQLMPWRIALCCCTFALVACEARVVGRIVLRDQRPESQTFLISLARLRACPRENLVSTFPLAHSQRFILQVLDGFSVHEPDQPVAAYPVSGCPSTLVLSRQTAGDSESGMYRLVVERRNTTMAQPVQPIIAGVQRPNTAGGRGAREQRRTQQNMSRSFVPPPP